ncbi:hypothetical protein KSP40_PGU013123 [Platanthera guangdongensis]|uniref:Uncharacterized protein n=1 Tax=Platanthera guangdongensis TaxID=2320717 RepID=A0ABR2MUE4_9ASPA
MANNIQIINNIFNKLLELGDALSFLTNLEEEELNNLEEDRQKESLPRIEKGKETNPEPEKDSRSEGLQRNSGGGGTARRRNQEKQGAKKHCLSSRRRSAQIWKRPEKHWKRKTLDLRLNRERRLRQKENTNRKLSTDAGGNRDLYRAQRRICARDDFRS